MSIEFELIEDTLSANIPANEAFLQFEVSKIHADGFTLGLSMDEDNPDTSKNHWAIILETPGKNIRLSMESRENNRTGKNVDDFLSFVYTKHADQPEMISVKPKPIDLGKFL
ncbi:hypothetical protein MY10362_009693 [Beauveria mimosiformis]